MKRHRTVGRAHDRLEGQLDPVIGQGRKDCVGGVADL